MKTKILLILPLLGIFFVVFTNFAMAADCEFNYSATVNQELEISINSLAPCLPANYAVGSGSIILPPTCGVINEINSQRIRYTPTSCCGTDSFEFNATKKNNPPVIVRINVFITCTSQPPTANNDSNSTNEDTQLVVSAPGVLGNDTDPESDPLTASKVSDPSHGTVTLNSNGSYTYTPDANYCGTDSFTYRAHDGLSYSNTATVTITVNCINDPPTAVDDTISTTE
ncbi:MAG: tandem-95 repeat protein, partial [Candidatus Methanofastidiosa archaeon]|nr:tandem-95 repeat protein [Candidatus Methanofastidiosa archaeon]